MRIQNKFYNIDIDKTIVLIADIHYTNKKDIKHLDKVLNKIKDLKPDYICIPGDIIDKSYIKDEDCLVDWLNRLSNINTVIVSMGNHEYRINKRKKLYGFNENLFKKIESISNLYLLDNSNVVLGNINFIGLTLPIEHYYLYKEKNDPNFNSYLNFKANKKYYNILLCHSPFNIVNTKLNVDLVLCGHTHGGVIPKVFRFITKNNGLIDPCKRLFPKNIYGNIKKDNTNILITSGISVLPKGMGIFKNLFASEIVIIKRK